MVLGSSPVAVIKSQFPLKENLSWKSKYSTFTGWSCFIPNSTKDFCKEEIDHDALVLENGSSSVQTCFILPRQLRKISWNYPLVNLLYFNKWFFVSLMGITCCEFHQQKLLWVQGGEITSGSIKFWNLLTLFFGYILLSQKMLCFASHLR